MGAWRGPGRGRHASQAGSGTSCHRGRGVRGERRPCRASAASAHVRSLLALPMMGALEENARPGGAPTSPLLTVGECVRFSMVFPQTHL